ncbi:DUF2958 domain-containing protein [Nostoc sp. NIES-2111]
MTQLFTQAQTFLLLHNGSEGESGKDHRPVVKLFTPNSNYTWLLTECTPGNLTSACGLSNWDVSQPTLGRIDLQELATFRSVPGLSLERDPDFQPTHPISVYAAAAAKLGFITTDKTILDAIAESLQATAIRSV